MFEIETQQYLLRRLPMCYPLLSPMNCAHLQTAFHSHHPQTAVTERTSIDARKLRFFYFSVRAAIPRYIKANRAQSQSKTTTAFFHIQIRCGETLIRHSYLVNPVINCPRCVLRTCVLAVRDCQRPMFVKAFVVVVAVKDVTLYVMYYFGSCTRTVINEYPCDPLRDLPMCQWKPQLRFNI